MSKQKQAMRHGMSKPHGLKVRCYADFMIDLNDYLAVFPGSKASDKIRETSLNGILFHSVPNSWIRQSYVQGFNF